MINIPHTALAQKSITITADRQFEFASNYFESGKFDLAAQEYQRFLYFFPDDPRAEKVRYQTGMSYFNHKDYAAAIDQFSTLINQYGESELSVESYFMISRSYQELNAPGDAVATLRNFIAISNQPDLLDRAYHEIAWIYIDAAVFDDAKSILNKISPSGKATYGVAKVEAALDDAEALGMKNPRLAAGLSILPGAGQLYCNRYKDALIAFVVNSAMIWATVEAFNHENYALGTLLGAVEAGFYTGNIYSAASSAHKYNRRQTRTFIEKLKKNAALGIGPAPDGSGVMFSFNYRF